MPLKVHLPLLFSCVIISKYIQSASEHHPYPLMLCLIHLSSLTDFGLQFQVMARESHNDYVRSHYFRNYVNDMYSKGE